MKVFVSGWFGNRNLGDELISVATVYLLKKAYPKREILLASYDPSYSSNVLKKFNLSAKLVFRLPLSKRGMFRSLFDVRFYKSLKEFKDSEIFVLGGGGFLSDWKGNDITGWLRLIRVAKTMGKRTILFCVGTGPFYNERVKREVLETLDTYCDFISVRDQASKKNLISCGVPAKKIHVFADTVLLARELIEPQKFFLKHENKRRKKIALNFIDLFSDDVTRNRLYTEICLKLIETLERNHEVFLLSFDKRDNFFLGRYTKLPIFFSENIENVLKFLANMDIVFAQRYHLIISSLIMRKKLIPLIYHHKSWGVVSFLNLCPYSLHIGDGSQWKDNIPTLESILHKMALVNSVENIENKINTKFKELDSMVLRLVNYLRDIE